MEYNVTGSYVVGPRLQSVPSCPYDQGHGAFSFFLFQRESSIVPNDGPTGRIAILLQYAFQFEHFLRHSGHGAADKVFQHGIILDDPAEMVSDQVLRPTALARGDDDALVVGDAAHAVRVTSFAHFARVL
jgi:hypothetical protein